MTRKSKVLIVISGILAVAVGFAAYWYFALEDWRHGDGICEVHRKQMRTKVVSNLAGTISYMPEYLDARETLFPNAATDYGPLSGDRKGKIYVCDECEEARSEWLKNFEERTAGDQISGDYIIIIPKKGEDDEEHCIAFGRSHFGNRFMLR